MFDRAGGGASLKAALAFLFVLNVLVGLFYFNEGIFHYDGICLARAVEKTYQTGVLQPAVLGRYGSVIVGSVVYFPFFLLGQNADQAIRLAGLLCHALSVVALGWLIFELFADRAQAFFGGLLLSFVPFYFMPNTYGKEHGMSMFFLLSSFVLLLRGQNARRPWLVVVAGLTYIFAVSIRESILVTFPLYLLLFFQPAVTLHPFRIAFQEERLGGRMFWAGAIPIVLALGVVLSSYLGQAIYQTITVTGKTFSVSFMGPFSWMLARAGTDLAVGFPGIFFGLIVIGIFRIFRRQDIFLGIFLLLWALTIFYYGNLSNYCPRFLDQVAVPLCILASYALAGIFSKYKWGAGLIAAYCALSMFLMMYPMLDFRHHYNGEKRLALFIESITEPDAVIITADDAPFIEYYGHRQTMFLPLVDLARTDQLIQKAREYARQGRTIYFSEERMMGADYFLKKFWKAGFDIALAGECFFEDFHKADLKFLFQNQRVYKLILKKDK